MRGALIAWNMIHYICFLCIEYETGGGGLFQIDSTHVSKRHGILSLYPTQAQYILGVLNHRVFGADPNQSKGFSEALRWLSSAHNNGCSQAKVT